MLDERRSGVVERHADIHFGVARLALVLALVSAIAETDADLISGFVEAVGGFFGDLWDRLGEFVTGLTDG